MKHFTAIWVLIAGGGLVQPVEAVLLGNHPEHVVATLGIDNVQAVPEPSTLVYLLMASGGLIFWRRNKATDII